MQKIATKLTARVAKFVNQNNKGECDYVDMCKYIDYYFHFPSIANEFYEIGYDHLSVDIYSDYTEVTEQQFIDLVTEELNPKPMTKCIVLGQENEPVKELKKIELKKCLQYNTGEFSDLGGNFLNINLSEKFSELALNPTYKINDYDLIYATTRTGSYQIWLGHWNDGIV